MPPPGFPDAKMADAGSVRHRVRHRATGSAFETDPDAVSAAPVAWCSAEAKIRPGGSRTIRTVRPGRGPRFPHSVVESEDTSVSSLWTPSGGEPRPRPDPGGPAEPVPGEPGAEERVADEQVAEELRRVRAELATTSVADLVANHAIGLWQLAVLHLTPEEDAPIRLSEAGLAIDAMAALLEGVGDRLGENEAPLRDALSQLRLAFVQVSSASLDS